MAEVRRYAIRDLPSQLREMVSGLVVSAIDIGDVGAQVSYMNDVGWPETAAYGTRVAVTNPDAAWYKGLDEGDFADCAEALYLSPLHRRSDPPRHTLGYFAHYSGEHILASALVSADAVRAAEPVWHANPRVLRMVARCLVWSMLPLCTWEVDWPSDAAFAFMPDDSAEAVKALEQRIAFIQAAQPVVLPLEGPSTFVFVGPPVDLIS